MKTFFYYLTFILFAVFIHDSAFSQPFIEVVAGGFTNINGITLDDDGNLWVAEGGTGLANDSKISVITPDGTVHEVVAGLPSFLDTMTLETNGAWIAYLRGNTLFVVTAVGDMGPGVVLTYDLTGFTPGDPAFTINDAMEIVQVGQWSLTNGFAETNPYRLAWNDDGDMFIADAAANAVLKRDATSGQLSAVATFAPIPNTFTPFPPVIDYVPTGIAANPAGGFYVSNLTGFPFVSGISSVVKVAENGTVTPFATGLTHVVEVEVDPATGDVYALQFAEFNDTIFAPEFGSAKITKITSAGDTSTFAAGFGPSPGMALDGAGGVYVTSLFTGEVLHITFTSASREKVSGIGELKVYPNPAHFIMQVSFSQDKAGEINYTLFNSLGERLASKHLGKLSAGEHSLPVDLGDYPEGVYFLQLLGEQGSRTVRVEKF